MTRSAEIESQSHISAIWILPLLAFFIGVWMIYQYQTNKGVEIFIRMPHAEGIINEKTEIKVRSVKMGIVQDVKLSDDQKFVIARAEVDKRYKHLLNQDAKIWVVKPRIDQTGITGMNTLLSGVYLEFLPGKSEKSQSYFQLLEEPPLISEDIIGGRYNLLSRDSDTIEVGTGIYYKGFKVGQVETANFDWQEQTMRYKIFIRAPFQNLVTLNSVFWVNSAIEVDLSVDGINVKTGSLAKMLKGGISFTVPLREQPGAIATDQHIFSLSSEYKTALEQRYYSFDYYVVQFEQSIRGLNAGAPVEYRGIRIGTVVEAPALLVVNDRPAYFSTEKTSVPVLIKVEYRRIFHDAKIAKEFWKNNLDKWIEKGMRASLKPGNLLTGAIYVDLDMYQNMPPYVPSSIANHTVIPTTSSGFTVMANQVSDVLTKFNKLEIEQSLVEVNKALEEYKLLGNELRGFLAKQNTQDIPLELNQSLQQVSTSMRQFDQTMKQFENTMADFQQGSMIYKEIKQTLAELKKLGQELQPFSKSLNEQPNILIFNKTQQEDIKPRKQK